MGREDFEFPGTYGILNLPPSRRTSSTVTTCTAAISDLRALPWLTRQVPTVLTLHDGWPSADIAPIVSTASDGKRGAGNAPISRLSLPFGGTPPRIIGRASAISMQGARCGSRPLRNG
jgi:hypothetical protein